MAFTSINYFSLNSFHLQLYYHSDNLGLYTQPDMIKVNIF